MPILSFFLKLLLPFLNEAFFGNASFKEWAKRNISTGIWLLLMLIMLGTVIRLVFLLNTANGDIRHLKQTNHSLQYDKDHYSSQYSASKKELNREIANLKSSLVWLQEHCIIISPRKTKPVKPITPNLPDVVSPTTKPTS